MHENDLKLQASDAEPLPLVVVIEPREEKAFATRLAGETEGLWTTEVVTSLDQLRALKKNDFEPVCIGFHATQARLATGKTWRPEPFHDELRELGWQDLTVLLSGGQDDRLKNFAEMAKTKGYEGAVARDGWVAYLRQKVSQTTPPTQVDPANLLQRLSKVFAQGGILAKDGSDNLGDYAQRLGPAVVVLREPQPGQAPQVLTRNKSATLNPWSRHDWRRWAWLRAQLDVFKANHSEGSARAHLLDWDGNKKQPVECRLYELGNGDFWYTRDWRLDQAQAIDEVFARIETERSLAGRFDGLADYLAHRWSISRLRLFEVATLPDGRGTIDGAGHWLPNDAPLNGSFLVVPRLQSGLGWPAARTIDSANERQPSGWWRQRFTWTTFTAGQQERPPDLMPNEKWIKRTDVDPRELQVGQQHYVYESMNQPCEASKAVDWGECKQRLLVLVPERSELSNMQRPVNVGLGRPLVAMLAMDRRADHLLGQEAKRFNKEEVKRIEALSEGVIGEELDAEVVKSMNHGALSALRDRVGQWLADARLARERLWDAHISRAIADTVGQGQGMAALSKLCDALLEAWPKLWEEERARLSLSGQLEADAPILPNLSQLFFVTPVGERQVAMPAGSGVTWAHYSSRPSWPMVTPFADLLRGDVQVAECICWVMQDFQAWWRDVPLKSRAFVGAASQCFDHTGSWVAMRLPDAPGVAPVLMVAHFDGETNQVWLEVLQLLCRAAHHVRAPFLLAWNEMQERSVWATSVAHEMKNMALLALHDAQLTPSTSPLLVERLQQQLSLAEDFLFNLRPDLSPDTSLSTQVQVLDVKRLLENSLSWWQKEQSQSDKIDVHWGAELDFSYVPLVGAQAWQRVLRVLLHNAFQHGSGGLKLAVAQLHGGAATNQSVLELVLENRASATAVKLLNQTASLNLVSMPSAYVRRHIGLKTARALCQQAGAMLQIQAQAGQVTVRLTWPMAHLSKDVPYPVTHHPVGIP